MSTSRSPEAPRSRRSGLFVFIGLALLIAGGGLWYAINHSRNIGGIKADPIAATEANVRGIGHMEQFEYEKAVPDFEKAVELAPDWLPAKINLAIALLNTTTPENLARATTILEEVLKTDPDNPHAHYTLGIIHLYGNRIAEAAPHFEAVTRIDPTDAHAWYNRGVTHPQKDDSPVAKEFFRKALALNPYLNAARYALALHAHDRDEAKTTALLNEHRALVDANWEHEYSIKYSEMGRYAEVIGKSPLTAPPVGALPVFEAFPNFAVTLAPETRWASKQDIASDADGELRQLIHGRFGSPIVTFDYDRDGKLDLFIPASVIRKGQLQDLLLHNEGAGKFTDVSATTGVGPLGSLGVAVADFDNDTYPDLLLTGTFGIRLFRNAGGKQFTDVSAAAGFDKIAGVYLASTWLDLDQDGDLDALVGRIGGTKDEALAAFRRGQAKPAGGLAVLLNAGEAPPAPPGTPPPPLTVKFRQATDLPAFAIDGPVTGIIVADLDADKDLDVVVLVDSTKPIVILNDRLLRFRRGSSILEATPVWSGGLALEANGDEQSDLLFLTTISKPLLRVDTTDLPATDTTNRFTDGATDGSLMVQAQAIDIDLDGRTDVVGIAGERKPVVMQGDGKGKLVRKNEAFGPVALATVDGMVVVDLDGDGPADAIFYTVGTGLTAVRSLGNGNHAVVVELTGRRDKGSNLRTNTDGIGATVTSHAGATVARVENTTLSAGLGQSRSPITLGLGKGTAADVVRVRWPDGVPQAELAPAAGALLKIVETNRKGTSCPILFVWDGTRYRYVTDFLGGGALGEMGPDGSVRPPRPEESLHIAPGLMVPVDGQFRIKIAEPMDEVMYLDHLRLEAIDHLPGTEVIPDERFATGGPAPTQKLLSFSRRVLPVSARDHRGADVTAIVRDRDQKTVDRFAHRSWLGFAQEHAVEVDFGPTKLDGELYIVLAGWCDYPYPESIYAASQAGVDMFAPILEQQLDGKWVKIADLGMPAGLPKIITCPLPESARNGGKFRIRTNLQIYWDQIYLAGVDPAPVQVHSAKLGRAELQHRGFAQEVTAGPRTPQAYDDDRREPVAITRWAGKLTRLGDVTPLLTKVDDCFVLCGPGEEVTVSFDAGSLPPVPPGMVRSYVLRTHGYCKDTSSFTRSGGSVGPLPWRGMGEYPTQANDRSKAPPAQEVYDREWNTRPASGR